MQVGEDLHCHRPLASRQLARIQSFAVLQSLVCVRATEDTAVAEAEDRSASETATAPDDLHNEDPRSHLTLFATVNAAPAWVAYSSNIDHVQRPWVIAMSWSAANVDVWHCCAGLYACVQAL